MRSGALGAVCLALIVTGCSPNRVQGAVGDEEIRIRSTFFSEHPGAFGEDGIVFVVLSEVPDACSAYGYYHREAERLSSPADQAALWATLFPESFWEILIPVRVADPSNPLARMELPGLAWDALLETRNHWFARFTQHTAHRDVHWYDGTGATADYLDEFLSHKGHLSLAVHEPSDRLKGTARTLVVHTDTEQTMGLVRVHFDARYCHGVLGL